MGRLMVMFFAVLALHAPLNNRANASEYPEKTVQLIIPFDPGTVSDQIGRLIATLAEPHLGAKIQPVNKPGGAGALGFTAVKDAKPDGYTIGMGTANLAAHKIYGNLDFDHNDLEAIIVFHLDPSILCVSSASKFHSLREFVDDAWKRPGELTFATGSPGSVLYAAAKAFIDDAGIDVKLVPCGGGGAQPPILAGGGHVDACISSPIEARAQLEAGNIRPIAAYLDKRHAKFPDVPSFVEEGYTPKVFGMRGIIAPKGTPKPVLIKLHDAFKKAMDDPVYQDFIANSSTSIMYGAFDDAKALYDVQQKAFAAVAEQE